ncbi:L,D-transpeptidase [Hyphomicrobium sp. CS1BSMeth3]|uniref:L,D-transpeptidase n=1 Tax=Hyphomicrobium sp. CS1BSMeth3 TaxID=1892844 RepID=UPI000931EAE6|nr:L,D-transpeptidase [Hyphomicrobium sp. CS1BSMeth3]
MNGTSRLRSAATGAVAALAALLFVPPQAAQAQGLFDWLSGEDTGKNTVSDRRVVHFDPAVEPGEVIVSFGDRRLYHVTSRGRAVSYPISVPRAESRWEGVQRVTQKRVDPPWTPTAEMRRENPSIPPTVPGGDPKNPMGARALYLGSTLYRIHGTDAPSTIGQNVSRGCVRMHNAHVIELYERIPVGAKVTATWKRFNARAVYDDRIGQSDWRPW